MTKTHQTTLSITHVTGQRSSVITVENSTYRTDRSGVHSTLIITYSVTFSTANQHSRSPPQFGTTLPSLATVTISESGIFGSPTFSSFPHSYSTAPTFHSFTVSDVAGATTQHSQPNPGTRYLRIPTVAPTSAGMTNFPLNPNATGAAKSAGITTSFRFPSIISEIDNPATAASAPTDCPLQ